MPRRKLPHVVNIIKTKKYDVYIGRPSIWGNPWKIGADGTRKQVIKKHRDWLAGKVCEYPKRRAKVLKRLPELRGEVLACWCKPASCHGDILLKLANK